MSAGWEMVAGGRLALELAPVALNMDRVDSILAAQPNQVNPPVVHRFVPGMYIREIMMPKGSLGTSKIHKTEHPFAILEGEVSVWSKETGVVRYKAPYFGITTPGTRRLLYNHENTKWITFHPNPTNESDLAKVEDMIIEKHDHKRLTSDTDELLGGGIKELLALTGGELGEVKK